MVLKQKLLNFILLTVLLTTSACENYQEKYSEKCKEVEELEESLIVRIEHEEYISNLIEDIHKELYAIDSSFLFIPPLNKENPENDNKALEILGRINILDAKVKEAENKLDKSLKNNRELYKSNTALKKLIKQYKNQIIKLKERIIKYEIETEEQKETIQSQEIKIDTQLNELAKQKKQLAQKERELLAKEINTYVRLSDELYSIAYKLPTVKGWFTGKTKREISQLRNQLNNEAHSYKSKADNLRGY